MSPLLKKNRGADSEKATLRRYCFYSALVSCGIMLFMFLCHKVIPFYKDTNTVLRMDLYHQYGPLYSELYDRIVNGYSLLYSWRSGLGGGFLGNFYNYCCSPFAVIMLIMGHKNMPDAIALMFLLKAMCSSAAFTYYINKTNRSLNKYSIVFGPMYAFCSYFAAYSWNIMWIDAMAVFPLVILGIENIIQKKKPSLFIFALTYTMITNYYMAYMVCILSVLYFLYFFFSRYEFSSKLSAAADAGKNAPVGSTEPVAAAEEGIAAEASDDIAVAAFDLTDVPTEGLSAKDEAVDTVISATEESTVEAVSGEVLSVSSDETETDDVIIGEDAIGVIGVPDKKSVKRAKKLKKRGSLRNNRFFATGCIFAFSAILCFLLAAFALIPVSNCLRSSSATSASFPSDLKTYFNVFDFIANHLPATETTIRSSGSNVMPNVYCGLVTIMMLPLYFFSDKVSGRKKVAAAVLLAAFFFGFNLNYFNFIWHGFHFPNDLPYRYSFAYSFILLTLAYKVITEIDEFSKKTFTAVGMAIILFVALITKLETPNNKSLSIWLTVFFTVVYTIIFGLYYSPRYTKKNVRKLLMFTIVVELIFADAAEFVMSQPKKNYVSDYDSYRSIVEVAEKGDTTPFYRTELSKLRARMDPCWYGYNGVSTFSSMAYEDTSGFMKKLGLFGNKINSYTYFPQTPVFNSLFGLKYVYDNTSIVSAGDYYTEKAKNDTFTAYEYKYYLPIAYAVNNGITEWNNSDSNPFNYQNSILSAMTGIDNVLVSVKADDVYCSGVDSVNAASVNSSASFTAKKADKENTGTVRITVKAEQSGYYYTYAGSTKTDSVKVTADNGYSYEYTSSSIQPFVLDIGHLDEGEKIDITYTVTKDCTSANLFFSAARLDEEAFGTAYEKLKAQSMNITEFNDADFSGTVTTTAESSVIFTSIPYDESWVITVDGQVLEYVPQKKSDGETDDKKDSSDTDDEKFSTEGKAFKACGALIGIDIGEGTHTVTFKYVPAGLSTGLRMTSVGAVILVLLLVYKFAFADKLKAKNKGVKVFEAPDGFVD